MISVDIASPLRQASALDGIGRCDLRIGNTAAGAAALAEALAIYQRLGAPRAAVVAKTLDGLSDLA